MTAPTEKALMPSPSVHTEAELPAMLRARPFGWFLIITGVIAWLASATLVLERLSLYVNPDQRTSCDFNSWIACSEVMKTPQATIFGFPNPLIGLVAFTVIITTGVMLLAGASMSRWYWIGLQIGVTAGFVLVCWFWTQALYVLAILCPYCMIVWAMMIPLFVWITVRNLRHGVIPAPAVLTKFLTEWAWVIVGLAILGVIASIFFRFMHAIIGS